MKKYFLIAVALLMMSASAKAQVTIGATTDPHEFSLLELVSEGERGLRLPQMNFCEHKDLTAKLQDPLLTQAEKDAAKGLQIFNTDTKCVETWNGSKWIQTCPPEGPVPQEEQILFTIKTNTDNDTYYIPTSGYVGGTYHSYDWYVSVDCGAAEEYHGTGSDDSDGILLPDLSPGTHRIRITPFNPPAPGWGNAFGHTYYDIYDPTPSNANTDANRNKLISIDAPLTTLAFAPEVSSDPFAAADATYMFAYTFAGCTNLTTPAKIVDTYKLPPTVEDLSHFLESTHDDNTTLKDPINLSDLKGWLYGNTMITHLGSFLYCTHAENTSLKAPINLTPLAGWFKENTSINSMEEFLRWTHAYNTALEAPIDLTPLAGWFKENTSMMNLDFFLAHTHQNNTSLKLEGQTIFPIWIKTLEIGSGTLIKDVRSSFFEMFRCNPQKQTDDSGEPKFQDGSVLSSLGTPNNNPLTYTGRFGFNPVNPGWQ
ncbi:MAG: hypothetical protein LBS54_07755 [Dysgonamonadaceae bacterium]|jgi:hypothetical protein|nr:hypothetical protein [Dysgonamonadaceae bacterium]